MAKSISYNFKNKFDFDNGINAETLIINSPSYELRHSVNKLKQKLAHVFKENESSIDTSKIIEDKKEDTKEAAGDIPEEFYLMMIMRSSIDYSKFIDNIEDLIFSSSKLNGNITLKLGHMNKIDPEDWDAILGLYVVNFLLPSAISKILKN